VEKTTTISFAEIDGVEITPINRKKYYGPKYFNIGEKYQKIIISKLSNPARIMLSALISNRDKATNRAKYVVHGVTAKCSLTKAYRELKDRGIVTRTKKQHYLINPSAILPGSKQYNEVRVQWNAEVKI